VASNSHGADLQRSTLQVSNLSCLSCVVQIESELKKIPGMVGVTTDLRRGIVEADHGSVPTPAQIAEVITNTGYPAQVLSTRVISAKEATSFGNKAGSFCGPGGCSSPKNCGAAGSAWKELYQRIFKKETKQ
jgi:copper chaperone CopZ